MAEPMPGPREERFRQIARRHSIWLVPGSMFEAAGGKVYNTVPVIDPQGTVVALVDTAFIRAMVEPA